MFKLFFSGCHLNKKTTCRGPGATRKRNGYTENRRLSWETFSTYNHNQKPPNSGKVLSYNTET